MISSHTIIITAFAVMLFLALAVRSSGLSYFPRLAADIVVDVTISMQIVVTLLVLLAGLYVILEPSYASDDKKWGYGIVGTVVGYWLKGAPSKRSRNG
jgi:hypothetical protein